jgi:hypothetical protein
MRGRGVTSSSQNNNSNSSNSSRTIPERIAMAQKYYRIYNLFSGANGCLDVWEGVLTLLNDAAGRAEQAAAAEAKSEPGMIQGAGGGGGGGVAVPAYVPGSTVPGLGVVPGSSALTDLLTRTPSSSIQNQQVTSDQPAHS